MDRTLVYPLQVPLETDILNTNRDTMVAFGGILQMLLGGATTVVGFGATPVSPAGLGVTLAPGSISISTEVDPTNGYSTLGTDTNATMKMGMSYTPVTIPVTAPATAGYSQNFLIQVEFVEADSNPVVLPYLNASNPLQALAGPGGNQAAQNSRRLQQAVLSVVAGAPAPTGSQTTPAVTPGCTALYTVTVANGQTAIVPANIVPAPGVPFLTTTLLQIPIPVPSGTLTLYMSPTGNDNNPGTSAGSALVTFAGAVTVMKKYVLTGLTVILVLAAGSYVGHTFSGNATPCNISIQGAGSTTTTIVGSGGALGAPSPNAVGAISGVQISVSGVTVTATGAGGDYQNGGCGLYSTGGSSITIGSDVTFGACSQFHMLAAAGASIGTQALGLNQGGPYKVTGGAQAHIYCELGGNISCCDGTITFVGTPAFSQAFIESITLGYVGYWNNTFVGSVTGPKYSVVANSVLNLAGASPASYVPGSTAGATAAGGVCI